MNIKQIIDFYFKNGLYQSKHDYSDKLKYLEWFYTFEHITIDTITDYCTYRKLAGVKNSTINREITVIRSAFNFWLKYHHDEQFNNIFNSFKLFEDDFIPRFLTAHECQRLLKAALQYQNTMLHDYINLMLNTGCRASELTTLMWNNVHIKDKYFIIRNSLSKNKKTVYKPLNDNAIESLLRLHNNSPYVFYNQKTGKHIRTFRRGFKLSVERAELGNVRIHDLRHTFASFLVKQGVPLYHVSTLLGHSDVRITQKYAHLAPDGLHNVLKNIPDLY